MPLKLCEPMYPLCLVLHARQRISRGKAGRAMGILLALVNTRRCFGSDKRDLEACVSSGAFDLCIEAVVAVASAGVDGLSDTNHFSLYLALSLIVKCREQPGCETKVRAAPMPDALAFCLENPLEVSKETSYTTDGMASTLACGVFGRDEGGSTFSFTQQQVDDLLSRWAQVVRAEHYFSTYKPDANTIFPLELSISDLNKPLLLNNPNFLGYLIDGLLLDPTHPRADLDPAAKAYCQTVHVECFAQIAVWPDGASALRRDPSVWNALRQVAEVGLSDAARQHAESALLALSDTRLQVATEGQKHIMLSCE